MGYKYDFENICAELNMWLYPDCNEYYQIVTYQSTGLEWNICWGDYLLACSENDVWWSIETPDEEEYFTEDEFIEECKNILARFICSMPNLLEKAEKYKKSLDNGSDA